MVIEKEFTPQCCGMRRLSHSFKHKVLGHSAHRLKHKSKQHSKDDSDSSSEYELNNIPENKTISLGDVRKKLRKSELVERHREQSGQFTRAKRKLSSLQLILQELYDAHSASLGTCICCRLGEIQDMVAEALAAYTKLSQTTDDDDDDERMQLLGTMDRLKEHCRRLSVAEHVLKQQDDRYAEMSSSDLVGDLERLDKEAERTLQLVAAEEAKLQRLGRKYAHVQTFCWLRRCGKMKEIIKEATEDCLTD